MIKLFTLKHKIGACFLICAFISLFSSVFAQNNSNKESWQILQSAEQAFFVNNFNSAMKLTQDAIAKRKEEVDYASSILTNALKPYQVRRAGDYIPDVLDVLNERQEYEAIAIIEKWLDKLGSEYFNHSIKKLTEFVNNRIEYPEAYFLIAKIYKLEGEFDMATKYLEKARSNSVLLEVPSQLTDILYEMAEIAENSSDTVTEEKSLIIIAQNDGCYKDETLKTALLRTSKSTKEDNSSRFFSLYRIDAINTAKAYSKLSCIYESSKRYQDAYLTNLYFTLICFTHVNSILEERESDYSYTNLAAFFAEMKRYPDIMKWANESGFFEGLYKIYSLGLLNKFERFPKDMITVLAESCPEKYWKDAAKNCLVE